MSEGDFKPRKKKRDLQGNYIQPPTMTWRDKVLNFKLVKVTAWGLFLFNGLSVAALFWAKQPGMAFLFAANCWVILAYLKVRLILDSYISDSQN